MRAPAEKHPPGVGKSSAHEPAPTRRDPTRAPDGEARGPSAARDAGLRALIDRSPQVLQLRRLQDAATRNLEGSLTRPSGAPRGLPQPLKAGLEELAGFSLDDVKVHTHSAMPGRIQAHAYAQGASIHLAAGQERHLPHEAWHVVQQKQGRVKPTIRQSGGLTINDDPNLEREADAMGARALAGGPATLDEVAPPVAHHDPSPPIQGQFTEISRGSGKYFDSFLGAFIERVEEIPGHAPWLRFYVPSEESWWSYHPPTVDQPERYSQLRQPWLEGDEVEDDVDEAIDEGGPQAEAPVERVAPGAAPLAEPPAATAPGERSIEEILAYLGESTDSSSKTAAKGKKRTDAQRRHEKEVARKQAAKDAADEAYAEKAAAREAEENADREKLRAGLIATFSKSSADAFHTMSLEELQAHARAVRAANAVVREKPQARQLLERVQDDFQDSLERAAAEPNALVRGRNNGPEVQGWNLTRDSPEHRWLSDNLRGVLVPSRPEWLEKGETLRWYVTKSSKSGAAFDVSAHIWKDDVDTLVPALVLHVRK